MQNKHRSLSADEHFSILRRFIESMSGGIYGSLLANGEERSVAIDATDYILSGLNNPLNNPFKPRKREPVKYRLGEEHWLAFASLLRNNSHILMGLLINSPYNWTVEEAYYEWKWLLARLDPEAPELAARKDKDNIARLQQVKAAWDSSVEVRITVEIGEYTARSIILDHRLDDESNVALAKRGLEQMIRGLNDNSFRKVEERDRTMARSPRRGSKKIQ